MPMLQSFLTWVFMIYLQIAGVSFMETGQVTEYYNYDDTLKIEITCDMNDDEGNWAATASIYDLEEGGDAPVANLYAEGFEDEYSDNLTYLTDDEGYHYWNHDLEGAPFVLYDYEAEVDSIYLTPDPLYPMLLWDSWDDSTEEGGMVYFSGYKDEEGMYVSLWDYYTEDELTGFEIGIDWEEMGINELFYEVFDLGGY